ncbi:MAG: ABC transporter permease [Oscillospiraceae bacterium]|nr:ABC transporter permease [Oscillospiraceae bacterium]
MTGMTRRPGFFGRGYNFLILFFLYAPIFVLIAFSFNSSRSRSVWTGFTFDWYKSLVQDESIMNAFYTTIIIAILSAVIATIAGTFAAVGFFSMRKKWRTPLLHINNIPMMNADIVTGVSLAMLFVALGSLLRVNFFGFATILIAHITFNIPYVILSIMPKLRQIDSNLVDAACDLGCTWMKAFWKVIVPEIMPGIINGLIIAFTLSVDDFVISYFTAGGNVMTLPMKIFAMTRRRISPEINALSTILFLTVLAMLIIINVREARQEERLKQSQLMLNR